MTISLYDFLCVYLCLHVNIVYGQLKVCGKGRLSLGCIFIRLCEYSPVSMDRKALYGSVIDSVFHMPPLAAVCDVLKQNGFFDWLTCHMGLALEKVLFVKMAFSFFLAL